MYFCFLTLGALVADDSIVVCADALGVGAVVGEGGVLQRLDHQRSGGDPGCQASVPKRLSSPALFGAIGWFL